MKKNVCMNRRSFLTTTGTATAGSILASSATGAVAGGTGKKMKVALVGTGIRGCTFWGKSIVRKYSDVVDFVGLCDINKGRLEFARGYIGVDCPVFTDFDEMLEKTDADMIMVTTMDSTHHEFIVKALEAGKEVLTEKPMTTDEDKCKEILDAERKSGKKVKVGFNYRYNPHYTKLRELLEQKRVGDIVSVDFHWYLNTYHGASYFRRWHGLRDCSGTPVPLRCTPPPADRPRAGCQNRPPRRRSTRASRSRGRRAAASS
ncbi:MAG: Gfo/Idh/MocA family oxidoreductase, partial [Kiritimatiellia bacterium]